MKLLFEEYHYKESAINGLINEHFYVPLSNNMAKVTYVGYYFNCNFEEPEKSDVIFILPKVFLDENQHPFQLSDYMPEDFIDLDEDKTKLLKDNGISDILFNLSVWIYQSLQFYLERAEENKIIQPEKIQEVVSNKGNEETTYLDSILQLKDFYKKHKNMLTYVSIIKNTGNNKIHWGKTISKEQPIIKDNVPAYISFRTKQKAINFDEELIVLFYSVLNYLKDTMHFNIEFNIQYELLSRRKIQNLIDDCKGTRYLKKIRKKYFVDEFVALWKLLYVFFDKAERIATKRYHEELVLAKDFQNIFEDMIDYLISDSDYPEELKIQDHGKNLVDHIYKDKSLIYNEKIYFVGDSKYYPSGKSMDESSIAKQYTYAKNIIQRNIDVIYGFDKNYGKREANDRGKYFPYRDEITHGYNVTPNFFISGITKREVGKMKYDISTPGLQNITGNDILYNRHFRNRLFDRDTLILQHYNINFLFVLTTYAAQNDGIRNNFRDLAKSEFRRHISEAINEHYEIYQILLPKTNDNGKELKDFVKRNYYELAGKIFSFNGILLFAEQVGEFANRSKIVIRNSKTYLVLEEEEIEIVGVKIGNQITKQFGIKEYSVSDFDVNIFSELEIVATINDKFKYDTFLPLYTVKGACGHFLEAEEESDTILGWVKISNTNFSTKRSKDYFVIQAQGDSMEPKIHDGDFCLFSNGGKIPRGSIVVAGIHDMDLDYHGRFTIKQFTQIYTYDDGNILHESVELIPLNNDKEYPTYTFDENNIEGLNIIGVFEGVLHVI